MRIIEQMITGKRSADACEDGMTVTQAFAAVVDGSTSKSKLPPLESGRTHGQVAMTTVCEYVQRCDAHVSAEEFCTGVTERLRQKYIELYDDAYIQEHLGGDVFAHMTAHPEDRFTCSAIVYSRFRDEVWMIGDCHCLVADAGSQTYYDNPKPMENVLASRRAEHICRLLAEGMTADELRRNDLGRAAILDDLKRSMIGQNRDYAVIDGFTIPMTHVRIIKNVLGQEGRTLILASDGYPRLFPTLRETENYLQDMLRSDPLMIGEHKATKCLQPSARSFDDRTYLAIACK